MRLNGRAPSGWASRARTAGRPPATSASACSISRRGRSSMRINASTIISPIPIGMAKRAPGHRHLERRRDDDRARSPRARSQAGSDHHQEREAGGERDRLETPLRRRRQLVDERHHAQVLAAPERERAAEHRKPQEQDRGQLIGPHQRAVEHVAREDAGEQDDDLGDDQRGGACFQEPRRCRDPDARPSRADRNGFRQPPRDAPGLGDERRQLAVEARARPRRTASDRSRRTRRSRRP